MGAHLGQSLYSIGVLDPTSLATAYSEIRAVSQDGSYVVGASQAPGATIRVPVVWSLSDGLLALPNPSGANSIGIGVSVGIGANAGNIIIAGLHEGNLTQRYYKAPRNNLTSGSWVDCAAVGGLPTGDMRGGMYNDLRSDPGVADGRWYTAGRQASSGRNARLRGDPYIGWNGTVINNVSSVSGYGVNVGRSSASPSTAFVEGPAFSFYNIPGSSGVRADGIGISPSFGKTSDFGSQWVCGQVNSYSGNTQMEGFRWMRGDASMTPLGTLPGHTSSCAYTIADNGVTAGRSYISGGETAVVWDTSGLWDTTGTATSIKDLLSADGVDTSMWSSLVRVYAASDDGRVSAGIGIWAADGSTRGFVATMIPEPGSLALLALGGTVVLLRRKSMAQLWQVVCAGAVRELSGNLGDSNDALDHERGDGGGNRDECRASTVLWVEAAVAGKEESAPFVRECRGHGLQVFIEDRDPVFQLLDRVGQPAFHVPEQDRMAVEVFVLNGPDGSAMREDITGQRDHWIPAKSLPDRDSGMCGPSSTNDGDETT